MRKLFLYAVLLFVVVIGGLALFLKITFNDENLKARLIPILEESTGYDVAIDHASLAFVRTFPSLGFVAEGVTFAEEESDVAGVSRLTLSMALIPLLTKSIVVKKLELIEPVLVIEATETESEQAEEPATSPDALQSFTLEQFVVRSGSVVYSSPDGLLVGLSDLQMDLSARINDMIALQGEMTVGESYLEVGGIPYLSGQPLGLVTEAAFAPDEGTLQINPSTFTVAGLGLEVVGMVQAVQEGWDMNLELASREGQVAGFWSLLPASITGDISGLEAEGVFDLNATVSGLYSADDIPEINAQLSLENGVIQYPGLPARITDLALEEVVLTSDALHVGHLQATMLENTLTGSGFLEGFSNPEVGIQVMLSAPDLARIAEAYPLPEGSRLSGNARAEIDLRAKLGDLSNATGDGFLALRGLGWESPAIEQPIENVTADIQLNESQVRVNNLNGKAGTSDFAGQLAIENYLALLADSGSSQVIPVVTGMLSSTYLNLDEQMGEDSTAIGPIILPNLVADVRFEADELLYNSIRARAVQGRMLMENNEIRVEEARANLFNGLLSSEGSLNLADPMHPQLRTRLQVNEFEAGTFFSSLSSMNHVARLGGFIEGFFESDVSVELALDQHLQPLLPSLKVDGLFGSKEARLVGLPLLARLSEVLNISELGQLALSDWSHFFTVATETMQIQELQASAGPYAFRLSGSQQFDGSLDMRLGVVLPETASAALANAPVAASLGPLTSIANTALVNPVDNKITLDFLIDGTFDAPALRLDTDVMRDRIAANQALKLDATKRMAQQRLDSLEAAARERAEAELAAQREALEAEARERAQNAIGSVIDSTAAGSVVDSLKEKGTDVLKNRLRGLLRKKNNE